MADPKAIQTAKALRKRRFKQMSPLVDRLTSGDKDAKRVLKANPNADSIYDSDYNMRDPVFPGAVLPNRYDPNRN